MMMSKNTPDRLRSLRYLSIGLILIISVLTGCNSDDTQTVVTYKNLVLQDEFDVDGAPDPSLWSYEIGTGNNGWGNNELQYYTDRTENVEVQNGMLLITAQKESFEGSGYTSARLITKGKFEQTYGRFEARMRLPYGQGMWPAFWMLGADIDTNPWPGAGEIDIMEYRGQAPTIVLGSVHGPGYSAGNAITKSYDLQNDRFDTGFHIFGIEWGPKFVNFYVDDVLYNQITPDDVPGEWVFNKPFYILINLAVGGSFVGPPNSETVFPQTMLVDYVRIYQ
ncbi:glycoside hydrolase family 16 protein [Fulvivirga sedimenti]|uniref:Glycoside hydrolase family 16 protein n=1 Tax=Fulvivirga sedimenti TaxID=2879465 RepID=A0A9X1HRT8_9BACT|nr:glycoside hydrolase family 16 protein [Fulvivirga sedimenti]MCA6074656.1 glycoside hydrolase family 16 protein [Fulvivirga sedimenti]MCA6075833.1 glycoside hydrolase family 16 protein [Fulvivirga sedimenti]MCA6076961.1 glycoside hydrolase family 16 protein [Fulvivirga sedimenti]